jgi:hypothetical protein
MVVKAVVMTAVMMVNASLKMRTMKRKRTMAGLSILQ